MRSNDDIFKEVSEECSKDGCQSWNTICLVAMEKAIKECKEEIIEQLEQISNNYEVIYGSYSIPKTTLDNYIYELEKNK